MDLPKYKCDVCSRRYFEPLKLKQHYSDVHDSAKIIQCEKCDFVAVHENTLKRHLINIHKKNYVKNHQKPQNSISKVNVNSQKNLKSAEASNIPLRRSNRNREK